MSIDPKKLINVKKRDGKIIAQCPACLEEGHDSAGNHLVIYPDGKYGCVVNGGDTTHSKRIYALVGGKSSSGTDCEDSTPRRFTVRAFRVPDSSVILDLGSFERFASSRRRTWTQAAAEPVEELPEVGTSVPEVSQPVGRRHFQEQKDALACKFTLKPPFINNN